MILSTSILSADFGRLEMQIAEAEKAGANWLHLDVMDGHFVPNISFGAMLVKSIRKETSLLFDVHLMIDKPDRYIEDFVSAGADLITIHAEAVEDASECIELIRSHGIKAGISINPDTPVTLIEPYLKIVDLVLVMSVYPGFGGQKYIDDVNEKIRYLKSIQHEYDFYIEVDGGINKDNVAGVLECGADVIVAGSAVFNGKITESIKAIKDAAEQ